ncbi:GNAT family N-acetyltransferase [Mesorhizobium sp. M0085]|uniref:GNAT family N-acetyltransferase n=1 Tax=Mesorhizobium sp. M0085 TaxID=2956872 RepID=UPI003339E19D
MTEFLGEVGYLHTAEEHRRQGHGDLVLRSLMEAARGKELFATIQSKNEPSQRLLGRHGYVRVGEAWPSERVDDDVNLFIRPKSGPESGH